MAASIMLRARSRQAQNCPLRAAKAERQNSSGLQSIMSSTAGVRAPLASQAASAPGQTNARSGWPAWTARLMAASSGALSNRQG